MDKSYFRIAEKIAARLLGCASKEEEQEVEKWGQQEGHRVDLLEKLNDPENFLDNQNLWSDFPVEEAWEKIQVRLEKKNAFLWYPELGKICSCSFSVYLRRYLVFDTRTFQSGANDSFASIYPFREAGSKVDFGKW